MYFEITKFFEFEAAHRLPGYEGKCRNLHGHSYKLEVSVKTYPKTLAKGIGIDTSMIKLIVEERIVNKLDHSLLNDTIKDPTMENICLWIHGQLKDVLPISKLRLWETSKNSVTLYINK